MTAGTRGGRWTGPVADEPTDLVVLSSERVFDGMVWDVRRDRVDLGDGQVVTREVIAHTGAVGTVVLDDDERVLLIRQYRHPVRSYLWEPPAGLLDVAGEDAWAAARRELAEEAHLRAEHWWTLVDFHLTPGASEESFRCYLARGLAEVADDERHVGTGEERDMPTVWLPLDKARDLVLGGRLHNPSAVVGVLAACAARDAGWTSLRPADAPWP
ncbi:MAG: NUDIX domain-containing protein, partial [Actinomycetes bacterium]